MDADGSTQESIAWLVVDTLAISGAVAATIAGFGMALYLVVGAARLALAFVV